MQKYLRSKNNGVIMDFNARMAADPRWETLTEQEAYPERFAPVAIAERKSQVDLTVSETAIPPPPEAPAELKAEASRPFKNARAPKAGLKGIF